MGSRNMAMLSSVSSKPAMSVRVGTKAAVPRPICAVDTSANRKVAMKALRAYLSVGSVRNQPRNRGENSLVPNWMMSRTMEVTNPVKASMPLPRAESAALALPALIARVRTTGSASSHRKSPTLSASARMTYTAGRNQRPLDSRRRARRKRNPPGACSTGPVPVLPAGDIDNACICHGTNTALKSFCMLTTV